VVTTITVSRSLPSATISGISLRDFSSGSFFYAVSDKDKQREVKISHQLHAFVRGDDERLSAVQTIIVVHRTHALHDSIADPAAFDLDEKHDIPFLFGLPRGYLHFQIRYLPRVASRQLLDVTGSASPRVLSRLRRRTRAGLVHLLAIRRTLFALDLQAAVQVVHL